MDKLSVAFVRIADFAVAVGCPTPLSTQPGCWSRAVDNHWTIHVNGHDEAVEHGGASVPPYSAAVEYNGWPAGMVNASGGVIAAGECANEDAFIGALEAATRAAGGDLTGEPHIPQDPTP
jgi:hypothetical protein